MERAPIRQLQQLESALHQLPRSGDTDAPARRQFLRGSEYVRVYRGVYLHRDRWEKLAPTELQLARILAAQRLARTPPVFSHGSAAVLLGLPQYGAPDSRVHVVTGPHSAGRQTAWMVRHRAHLPAADLVEIAGMRCTSPERTLLDLARSTPAETAFVAAEGLLRADFRVGRQVDWQRVAQWRAGMAARLGRLAGRNGARAAQRLLALADPRTDSVLESVSHLQLRRLGFELALQVPVAAPRGGSYYIDFEFLGLRLFGECDGKQKYTDPALMRGLSAEELVYREKRRQDWICAREQKRMVRWGHSDVQTVGRFAHRLLAFGVPVPKLPR